MSKGEPTVRANARTMSEDGEPAADRIDDIQSKADAAFSKAYSDWLKAKAGTQDPPFQDDDVMNDHMNAEDEAERRLMTTPAAYPDHVWNKLEAFETILGEELHSGARRYSVLMLSLGSIKQDIINLDLCNR